jgi:hypothetical protein
MFGRVAVSSPVTEREVAVHNEELCTGIRSLHAHICDSERELLRRVAECDRSGAWEGSGARDTAHWLAMKLGISEWKARRWVVAAHALEGLPRLSDALSTGELGIDKVVELARFARPEDEERVVRWARGVSCGAIRRRADLEARRSILDEREAERSRCCSWWYFDEGRRFGLEAELPAAQGAVVARALERLAAEVPQMPGEEGVLHADARRADALVALASTRIAASADADRSSVVVHVPLGTLVRGGGGCEVEGGPPIHVETARRFLCTSRIQAVVEDEAGDPVRIGHLHADPPAWMLRQLRHRDRECRFPGCGARRFLQAHHVVWRTRGGRTELANLVLICFFHHRLVHEGGWSVHRARDGTVRWSAPDGRRHVAGPAPPIRVSA